MTTDPVQRVAELEEAIRQHRKAMKRIFGSDYGRKEGGGNKSADAELWRMLGDQ